MLRLRIKESVTPLGRRLAEFRFQREPVRVELDKALSLRDLFGLFIRDMSAYYLDNNITRPLTDLAHESYAELVGPKEAEWFVSHLWGYEVADFCRALANSRRAARRPTGYVFFATTSIK